MELVLVHSNKINKGMIKVFNTPYIRGMQVMVKECFSWGYCKPSG
jgi:ribosomal protein L30/L7E